MGHDSVDKDRGQRRAPPAARVLPAAAGLAVVAIGAAALADLPGSGCALTLAAVAILAAALLAMTQRLRDRDRDARRLAAVVESSGDAIITSDENGRFTSWSPSATALFGYTREEAIGRSIGLIVPEDGRAELKEIVTRVSAGETVFGWETVRRHRDGHLIDVEVTVSPLRNAKGRPTGATAIIRDIRDRRAAEHRFEALLEASPDAMIITDGAGQILLANHAVGRLVGYAPEQVVGKSITHLLPERLVAAFVEHRRRFVLNPTGTDAGTEQRVVVVHQDGHEIPIEVSVSPLQTDEGLRVISVARDVTEQRRAARALAESEERFRRSFEDSGVGMALVLPHGYTDRLIEANAALAEITGYSIEKLRELGPLKIIHPDDLPPLREEFRGLGSGRTAVVRREVRLVNSDGKSVWVVMTVSLVRDAKGEPVHAVVQMQDISERKHFEGQLQHLADHDPLTGLFNRRRFEHELEREVLSARRYTTGGAVLVLDLDHFKYVNDSLGHAAGDDLIMIIGEVLRRRLRHSDIIGRMGGDEFAVILPRADEQEARRTGESLLRELRADVRAASVSGARHVTASIGVALFGHPRPELSAEELLAEADIAMYDAKEAGRDRLALFDPQAPRHERMRTSLAWVEQIESALETDRFVLHAQPILAMAAQSDRRYELLLRMVGEDGDLIPPGTFLDVAERNGLAGRIDRWVVSHAVTLLAEQQRRGHDISFEVNLSATSVTDSDMLEFIAATISQSGVKPGKLIFEITETAAIVNVGQAKAFVQGLRDIGCEFAIDDFGAGFASFYYLKHLAFDYLKIDGEFIQGLATSATNQLVVRSVADIARGLGQRTIAEFVDEPSTLKLLDEYGIDYAQGFFTGRPQPIDEIDFGGDARDMRGEMAPPQRHD